MAVRGGVRAGRRPRTVGGHRRRVRRLLRVAADVDPPSGQPGGQPGESDPSVFDPAADHRPSGQGNLAGGNAPAWHGGAADSHRHPATLSGFKSKEFGGTGYNQLVLDDSETLLRPGDVVVQRGTSHRWENRSAETARMAFILVDGAFTPELLGRLGPDVLGGLLHDPMEA